jgi:hypothetical protein
VPLSLLSFIGALAGYIRPLDDTPVGKSDLFVSPMNCQPYRERMPRAGKRALL